MLKSSFCLLLNPSISRSFDSNNLSFLLRIAKGSKSFSLVLFNIELSILISRKICFLYQMGQIIEIYY